MMVKPPIMLFVGFLVYLSTLGLWLKSKETDAKNPRCVHAVVRSNGVALYDSSEVKQERWVRLSSTA